MGPSVRSQNFGAEPIPDSRSRPADPWALLDLELHLRAFIQGTVAVRLDRRKVNEYVVAARPLDESIALGGVKPFHSTFFHLVPISCFIVCRAPARTANNFAGRTGPAAYGILSNGVSTVKHLFALLALPGTDETAMDFRRTLPEIRWQSRLSPASGRLSPGSGFSRLGTVNEPELIEKLRRRVALPRTAGLVLGIGDDCAIVRPRGASEDWLYTTDMLIEGTHFLRETHSAADVGWKALARGLSDIAAMGGHARFCLLSLAVADWVDARWLDGFYAGLLALAGLAERAGVALIGGDLARTERVMCDIVVAGTVPRGEALRRDGARPGDAIYVSGPLGGSALGLAVGRGKAWIRHKRPQPRLALGRFLRARLGATAAMDLSDGLSLDLHRLCAASHLRAEISPPPVYRGATLEQALHGGEDYELLFTAPARVRVPAAFEGLALTRIGTMRSGTAGAVEMDGEPLPPLGYDHLRHL